MPESERSHHLQDALEINQRPYLLDPILLDPTTVRVLIVTDDDGSFTKEHRFSLSELVQILRTTPSVFATFQVTTAHRSEASTFNPFPKDAMIKGFRFDNPHHFKPDDYDEIWLFGVANEEPDTGTRTPLSEKEKRIVAQFMDSGGGVFATGDHENLGLDLCSQLPRVRSMRKWEFDYSKVRGSHTYDDYIESAGEAPPVLGSHRHDTLMPGHDSVFSFDDQSDDVPAPLLVKSYTQQVNSNLRMHYPHPLLCGPKGVIRVTPDHMHEGECVVPEDLSANFTFDGYTRPEYPKGPKGIQPSPDVIAWLSVTTNHQTRLEKKDSFGGQPGQTQVDPNFIDRFTVEDTYGSIGAYDGHVVDIGRVVVDSTFHHFFNINLIGSGSNSADPIKQKGFTSTPQGLEYLEQFKAYYRNIAVWIARPRSQFAMFHKALWAARWDSQLRMQAPRIGREMPAWGTLRTYGHSVRETLERIATSCMVVEWTTGILDPLARLLASPWYELIHRPDPPPEGWREPLVDTEELVNAMLGGMMAAIFAEAPSRSEHFRAKFDERMPDLVSNGAQAGLQQAVTFYRQSLRSTEQFLDGLTKGQMRSG